MTETDAEPMAGDGMTETDAEPMAYLARDAHGCAVRVDVDIPEEARAVARFVADCIRAGLTVERLPVTAVRALRLGCAHRVAPPVQRRLPLAVPGLLPGFGDEVPA